VAAAVGPDIADDAVADTWAYAWSHWERLAAMENPRGYLYVTAKRHAHRSQRRRQGSLPPPIALEIPNIEPTLIDALNRLNEKQRTAVFLTVACQWRATEVAELLDMSASTVRTHVARGLAHLRKELEVELNVQP